MVTRCLSLLLFVSICFAGSATQTDWSGGGGVAGPVTNWADQFSLSGNSNYDLCGEISLELRKNIISQNISSAFSICSVDIDNDGDMDVVVVGSTSNTIDDDENLDVVVAGASLSTIAWLENDDGNGTSWTEHIIDTSNLIDFRSVYSVDIDNDGDMDIFRVCDGVGWYENCNGSGTSWTYHHIAYGPSGGTSAYSKDINSDGRMDVMGAAWSDNDITWWRNNGYGTTWTEYYVDLNFNGARSVYSEDINGDGYLDILGGGSLIDGITWWANDNGSGTSWTEHIVDEDINSCSSVYAGDINGDGDMDVLGEASNLVTWWDNTDGSGITWTEHVIDSNFEGARSIRSGDIDGDGDLDVLGAAYSTGDITWWENTDGCGTSWIEHSIFGNWSHAYSTFLEDIDNDGDIDVLGTGSNLIAWWDILTYSTSASLESSILNLQEPVDWQEIYWTSTEPTGTVIGFKVRSSNNPDDMGTWSATLYSPTSLSTILSDGDSLFQYKVFLSTTDSSVTPTLNDMSITWEFYTAAEDQMEVAIESYALNCAQPNPAFGNANIGFILPSHSRTTLTIFDITGRVVARTSGNYPAGLNHEIFTDLVPGVYQVRMTASDFTAVKQFVVR